MQSRPNNNMPTLLAFALLPLSGFATDIYIPSMPEMAKELNATTLDIQLTLGLFIVFYGIAQLFIGGVLDSYGRYRSGLLALLVFVISCLISANCTDIHVLFAMRIIQGTTSAIVVVGKRAYFIDVFSGKKLAGYLSLFTIIWATGPILAPFLGGLLQSNFGWQSNFYFLALYAGFILFLELLYSRETLPHARPFRIRGILTNYRDMLGTVDFSTGIAILCLSYSTVMVYNLSGAFLIERYYAYGPVTIGNCSLLMGLAWMAGGFLAKGTLSFSFVHKIWINISLQLLLVIVLTVWSAFYRVPLPVFVTFAFLIHTSAGFNYNNYFSKCLTRFSEQAATAGGLIGGVVNVAMFFLTNLIVGYVHFDSPVYLAMAYLVPVSGSWLLFIVVSRRTANTQGKVLCDTLPLKTCQSSGIS